MTGGINGVMTGGIMVIQPYPYSVRVIGPLWNMHSLVYGVWCIVYGVRCMVYSVWCIVYGVWCMVYGLRCMVYGVWCMVYVMCTGGLKELSSKADVGILVYMGYMCRDNVYHVCI